MLDPETCPLSEVGTLIGHAYGEPVVKVGEAQVPSVRNPIRLSATPPDYRYAPPALDEQGEELRRWLREPRRGSDG